jgi:anaerobic selenocysteine-containing dehydrogenase
VVKEGVKFFFAALGASGTRGSLCDGAGYEACLMDFGSRANPGLENLQHSATIVNWGKDLPRSSVHLAAAVQKARRRGARLLTVSPGGDGCLAWSDAHVRLTPGSDRFLAAAVIRKLLLADRVPAGIAARVRNWEPFAALLGRQRTEDLLAACGASDSQVEAIFEAYHRSSATATLIGTGLQRYRFGGENVRFINALATLSNHIGRPGGGVYYHLNSLRNFNLGWVEDPRGRPQRTFALPTIGRDILAARDPKVEVAWINGCNIVNQAPDARSVARAIEQIPFVVVVDAFLTDTARRADLVLPAALMLEQEDLVGSFLHDYVHHAPAVVKPPGEARDDLTIVRDLGRRLVPPIEVPDGQSCLTRALDCDLLDMSLDALRVRGFARARRPAVPYGGLRFDHPDGKCRLPEALHPMPPPDPDFPLRLMTLLRRQAMHSQIPAAEQIMPPRLGVAPECPALADLDRSRPVFLESPLGRMLVTLEEIPGLTPGAVIYRRGDWMSSGGGANRLVDAWLTDAGEGAAYYEQGVRLTNG